MYLYTTHLGCSNHRSISSRESMPHQAIRPHIGQSRAERILSSSLELIFLALFGSRPTVREHVVSSQDRPLVSSATDIPHGTSTLKNTLLLASHTEEPALRPVTRATCYSDTIPTKSRTNILSGGTKK